MSAVTDEDLVEVAQSLIKRAKGGDVAAIKELLDRLLGKAKATVAVETEPQRSTEDMKAELRALIQTNPGIGQQLAAMLGLNMLPRGTPPNEVVVAEG